VAFITKKKLESLAAKSPILESGRGWQHCCLTVIYTVVDRSSAIVTFSQLPIVLSGNHLISYFANCIYSNFTINFQTEGKRNHGPFGRIRLQQDEQYTNRLWRREDLKARKLRHQGLRQRYCCDQNQAARKIQCQHSTHLSAA
jgi:hypothetical protein